MSTEERDRLIHDAEHAESGAGMARAMGDDKTGNDLILKANELRRLAGTRLKTLAEIDAPFADFKRFQARTP